MDIYFGITAEFSIAAIAGALSEFVWRLTLLKNLKDQAIFFIIYCNYLLTLFSVVTYIQDKLNHATITLSITMVYLLKMRGMKMKKRKLKMGLIVTALISTLIPFTVEAEIITDRCSLNGSAMLESGGAMSGDVTGELTGATGYWQHILPDNTVLSMNPEWILCRINGALLGDFGGNATVDGIAGYTFRVAVEDHGIPRREIVEGEPIEEIISATHFYRPSKWLDGAVPIVGNWSRINIPTELPVTIGAPGNGIAVIFLTRADSLKKMQCIYDGNGQKDGGGDAYVFRHCTGPKGLEEVYAGDELSVTKMDLRVRGGDKQLFDETTITLTISVTPLTVVMSQTDFYRVTVWDSSDVQVFIDQGHIVSGSGDLKVIQLE